MNCKEGEMAIVVKSYAGNEGKVLTCVRYMGVGRITGADNHFVLLPTGYDTWEVDTTVNVAASDGTLDGTCKFVHDYQLRPLRGNLTDDEEEIVKELYTA